MDRAEYERRVKTNQHMSGYGIAVTMHMPCPFCGAAEFVSYRILEMQTELEKEHICAECKRGCKASFTEGANGLTFKFLQTCGEDPPSYVCVMEREN